MMINMHPTVEIPPWDPPYDDQATVYSPQTNDYFSALHRYLPSCDPEFDDSDTDSLSGGGDLPFDSFSCDNFRMYEFKVRRCARGRSHDWTECPYAHPGEKARRRDPRKYHYSGVACPDFRRGACRKGDSCEFAHGVFECWLHPARYRTQPCKDGAHCKRRVCFFAHSHEQLRVLPPSESPPSRLGHDSFKGMMGMGVSPVSVLECPESPPVSPSYNSVGEFGGGNSVGELVNSMRALRMSSPKSGGWGVQMGCGAGFGSPRSPAGYGFGGSGSVPGTPTRTPIRSGLGLFDPWDVSTEEEVPMERVESGKDLRARIYAKLSKDNSVDQDRVDSVSPGPDFGWVSELVK